MAFYRSQKYHVWLKKQECIRCGNPDTTPHHIKGIGHLSGCALRAPDWAQMPLCIPCHEEVQKMVPIEQWEWALRTLGQAIEQGVFK
ncbi:MAG: DUF968 domain-containing protein [Desulfobacteraceae bacterium]|nr:DUF968 domain-containing protein [Desulfobacteraceae bacterium]